MGTVGLIVTNSADQLSRLLSLPTITLKMAAIRAYFLLSLCVLVALIASSQAQDYYEDDTPVIQNKAKFEDAQQLLYLIGADLGGDLKEYLQLLSNSIIHNAELVAMVHADLEE